MMNLKIHSQQSSGKYKFECVVVTIVLRSRENCRNCEHKDGNVFSKKKKDGNVGAKMVLVVTQILGFGIRLCFYCYVGFGVRLCFYCYVTESSRVRLYLRF